MVGTEVDFTRLNFKPEIKYRRILNARLGLSRGWVLVPRGHHSIIGCTLTRESDGLDSNET